MLIHVMYPEKKYDYVKEFMLDNLIDSGRITRFRRSGGWVSVRDDLIRTDTHRIPYTGFEKRVTTG